MDYTPKTIENFLYNIEPFNQLPPEAITELAQKLEPLRFSIGKVILRRDKMPAQIAIIYEGEVRWLGYDPRTNDPVTIKRLGSGAVIGAVNVVRGIPSETATASEDVVCLTLYNTEFQKLLDKYPQISRKFQEQATLLEVFDLLGYQLDQQALGEGQLKELAQKAFSEAQVHYLDPGHWSKENAPIADSNWVWLLSGSGEMIELNGDETEKAFACGSRIELNGNEVQVKGSKPVRMIAIPRHTWDEILSEIKPDHNKPLIIVPDTLIKTNGKLLPEDDIRISDGPIEHIKDPDPQPVNTHGPIKKPEAILNSALKFFKPKDIDLKEYPYVYGKTPLEEGVAIFQMLSQYFNMPFRAEIIQRILGDQIQRHGNISLDTCGAVSELMGLDAQLTTIPGEAVNRLKVPIITRWQDTLAIIYQVSENSLIIGVPELGILERTPSEFLKTWGDQGNVLILKKTDKTPEDRFGLKTFLPYIKKYQRSLWEVFIASFFVQLFALANPLMIQVIIDKVIVQNSIDTLQVLGVFLLIVGVFEAVLTYLRTNLFVDTTNRIDMALGSEIINHLLRLPLRYFENRPVGEISTRINELENIRQFLTGTALTVVLDAIFSVIYIVVMLVYSWLLTLVALGIIPLFIALTWFFSPIIRTQLRIKAEKNAQTQSYLVEVMSGIQTVKAQNIELRSRWQWQERYAEYVGAGFDTVKTSTLASAGSNFLNKLSGLLVLWIGAYLVLKGQLSLGQLIAFRIIASYATSPILRLAQLWQNFQETALSLERLADIADYPQEAEKDRNNIPMPLITGGVKYENVCFRFKKDSALQLVNVNLEFAAGTFVGVVGESGAGKSTLTKVLSRLYEPESGRILVDGYDINKVELYSLRRQIGVVPQETLLFDGTVQENIALTNPDATTEEIISAARVAVAHDFIMNLPNGYNTRVGERGASLSGGQRQRIAIARSVLQQPRMLILDEATSALDYSTEQQVCIKLIENFRNRTVFFITHRLGTIRNADIIVLMDAGSVGEIGTHEELMKLKGRYYYLYQQQESKL